MSDKRRGKTPESAKSPSSQAKRSHEPAPGDQKYPRKRALRACHLCRVRKTKCDNIHPTCGSCAAIGTTCRYDDSQKDHSSFDHASLEILRQLGQILSVQQDLVDAVRTGNYDALPGALSTAPSTRVSSAGPGQTLGASPHAPDPLTPSWAAAAYSDFSAYNTASGSSFAQSPSMPTIPSTMPPSIMTAGVLAGQVSLPMHTLNEAGMAATGIPAVPKESATARWYELLATDVPDVISPTEADAGSLETGFWHSQNAEDMTPLQKATKIVDDWEDSDTDWAGKPPSPAGSTSEKAEQRLWKSEKDIQLLPQERFYLENFLEHISPWIDLFDPTTQFSNTIPQLARRNAGLLNAILALSCRHLSLHPEGQKTAAKHHPDRSSALQYYYQTLHYVQKAMRYPSYQGSLELLGTTLIVSTYEMIDGSRKAWERHLQGTCLVLQSQIRDVETHDFRSAVWWAWIRQDVWASFSEKRKTLTLWEPVKPYESLEPVDLAARSVWIMSQVVDFCSADSEEPGPGETAASVYARRAHRASELKAMLREWRSYTTPDFLPVSSGDDHGRSSKSVGGSPSASPSASAGTSTGKNPGRGKALFEPLRVQPPSLAVAVQIHHASLILVYSNEPTTGNMGVLMERQATIQQCIKVICGVAMTLEDEASSIVSSQCLFIAGMFVHCRKQGECIMDLMDQCKQRTGWSPQFLGENLDQIWAKRNASALNELI